MAAGVIGPAAADVRLPGLSELSGLSAREAAAEARRALARVRCGRPLLSVTCTPAPSSPPSTAATAAAAGARDACDDVEVPFTVPTPVVVWGSACQATVPTWTGVTAEGTGIRMSAIAGVAGVGAGVGVVVGAAGWAGATGGLGASAAVAALPKSLCDQKKEEEGRRRNEQRRVMRGREIEWGEKGKKEIRREETRETERLGDIKTGQKRGSTADQQRWEKERDKSHFVRHFLSFNALSPTWNTHVHGALWAAA